MQSRPTLPPFEVQGKLLRDSPLEETLQYGEHQQTGVHAKARNTVNPTEAPLHLHISLPLICADVVAAWWCTRISGRKLLFNGTQKWSESRTANKNIHINAPNNAYVYGSSRVVGWNRIQGSCNFPISAITSLTHRLAQNHQLYIGKEEIRAFHASMSTACFVSVLCSKGKSKRTCVLLSTITSKHLWLLVCAIAAW